MNDSIKKKLPIGIENFAEFQTEGFYYVDKTALIADLLHSWGKVNLFTRPRRFGKSLVMSMLKTFFGIGCEPSLFDGMNISKETELCQMYMGKFPVVSVSLKGVSGDSFETARSMMGSIIGNEALRLGMLAQSSRLTEADKARYQALIHMDDKGSFQLSDEVLMGGLFTLSALLEKHYESKVIMLIDEYDVPLAKASEKGYYDEMVSLIRNMFSQALKTNESLFFAVLTGCLCVSMDAPSSLGSKRPRQVNEAGFPTKLEKTSLSSQCQSIFTGMNNLKVLSIADVRFDEYFGFTDSEVKDMLEYYELTEFYNAVKEWYDGYRFGNVDVYCPWDVINYVDALRADKTAFPQNYWSNTSSNDIVRHFIEKATAGTIKREIEALVAGETVTKEINQELTYKALYDSIDNIWSVLFATGYLTQRRKAEGDIFQLAIPNMEIRRIFTRQIMVLFKENVQKDGAALEAFCTALKDGDARSAETYFTDYLKKTISIRDTFVQKPTKENFYHGILLGILGFKDSWGVFSNKESGDGYSDIQIEIDDEEIGIVIEVKYAHDADLDSECQKALIQIEKTGYADELRDNGMQKILKYGIACYKKQCRIVLAD